MQHGTKRKASLRVSANSASGTSKPLRQQARPDLSDIPEITPEEFARAVVRKGLVLQPRKRQLTLRIDEEVLDWFKQQGSGYQTKINAILRAYRNAVLKGR
jgi:uncharacterized protein (DUF4415 family)